MQLISINILFLRLSRWSPFFIALIALNANAGNLTLSSPDNEPTSDQQTTSNFEDDQDSNIEFTHSFSKNSYGNTSSAQWKNEDGFKLNAKYIDKQLNPGTSSSAAGFQSNSGMNGQLEMPVFNNSLKLTGKFDTGKLTTNQMDPYTAKLVYGDNGIWQPQNNLNNSYSNFNLSGKTSDFDYGVNLFRVGKDYKSLNKTQLNGLQKDHQGYAYWVSKGFGNLNLKASYTSKWNNLNSDPTKSRLTDNLMGVTALYSLSTWPSYSSISVSYQSGRRTSSLEPNITKRYSGKIDTLSANYYLQYKSIDFSIGSSLMQSQNDLNASNNSKILSHYISASYSLFDFYFSPSFSITDEFYNNSKNRYRSISPSLSLSYQPKSSPFNLSLYLSPYKYKGNDLYTNIYSNYSGLLMSWTQRLDNKAEQIFTFTAQQSNYTNYYYTGSNTSNLYIGINWTLTTFK